MECGLLIEINQQPAVEYVAIFITPLVFHLPLVLRPMLRYCLLTLNCLPFEQLPEECFAEDYINIHQSLAHRTWQLRETSTNFL